MAFLTMAFSTLPKPGIRISYIFWVDPDLLDTYPLENAKNNEYQSENYNIINNASNIRIPD